MPSVAPCATGSFGVIVHEGGGRPAQIASDRDAPPVDVDVASSSDDVVGRLREPAHLHAAGAQTDDELDQAKARVLE